MRRSLVILTAAAAVLVVGGGSAGAALLLTGDDGRGGEDEITVRGSLILDDPDAGFGTFGFECAGEGGYDDIRAGVQVSVTGPAGTVLAVGELDGGEVTPTDRCEFSFTVEGVPAGHGLYGIEVAHRGEVTFPEETLRSVTSGPQLSLGGLAPVPAGGVTHGTHLQPATHGARSARGTAAEVQGHPQHRRWALREVADEGPARLRNPRRPGTAEPRCR